MSPCSARTERIFQILLLSSLASCSKSGPNIGFSFDRMSCIWPEEVSRLKVTSRGCQATGQAAGINKIELHGSLCRPSAIWRGRECIFG